MRWMSGNPTPRAYPFYLYNTEEEEAAFLGALARVHEVLA